MRMFMKRWKLFSATKLGFLSTVVSTSTTIDVNRTAHVELKIKVTKHKCKIERWENRSMAMNL